MPQKIEWQKWKTKLPCRKRASLDDEGNKNKCLLKIINSSKRVPNMTREWYTADRKHETEILFW